MSRVGEMSNGFGETCFGTEDEKNDSLNLHDISQTLIMSIEIESGSDFNRHGLFLSQ